MRNRGLILKRSAERVAAFVDIPLQLVFALIELPSYRRFCPSWGSLVLFQLSANLPVEKGRKGRSHHYSPRGQQDDQVG
jgi:hypothetical protein